MSAAKIVGGILALAGGAFILIQLLVWLDYLWGDSAEVSCFLLNAGITTLAIVGGILGITGRRSGGVLALIGGAVAIFFGILTVYVTWDLATWPISFFTSSLGLFPEPEHLFAGITIESLLILAGGITIIASGTDK